MNAFKGFFDHSFLRRTNLNRYHVYAVTMPAEHFADSQVPYELQFAMNQCEGGVAMVKEFLARGFGIAVLNASRAPEDLLKSVDAISLTQERTIYPWVSRLIFESEPPVCSDQEILQLQDKGIHLYAESDRILRARGTMMKLALIDHDHQGISELDLEAMNRLNRALFPLSAAYLHDRIFIRTRFSDRRFSWILLRAALIIGPLVHFAFALSAPFAFFLAGNGEQLYARIHEGIRLRQSGYTIKQLWTTYRIYVPLLFINAWIAFSIVHAWKNENVLLAGLLFGFLSMTLPLIQTIGFLAEKREAFARLAKTGKLPLKAVSLLRITIDEMRRDRMWFGLHAGMLFLPLYALCIFAFGVPENGWVLSFLAISHVLFAMIYDAVLRLFDRKRFILRVQKQFQSR